MNIGLTRNPSPSEVDKMLARLVSYHWDLLTPKDRKAALMTAELWGSDWAEEAVRRRDDTANGSEKDYRRVCIRFAFEDAKVINDVERELWRSTNNDPRYASFLRARKQISHHLCVRGLIT